MRRSAPSSGDDALHAADMIQLAGIAAVHASQVIDRPARLPDSRLQQYWSASKCRLDRWGRRLTLQGVSSAEIQSRCVLLEELITAEALARVWAAILCADDRQRKTDAAAPIAQSVLSGQIEMSGRVLRLLADPSATLPRREARGLVRLHRRVARWTDLLVANVAVQHDVSHLAANPDRCRDFADDLAHRQLQPSSERSWQQTLASMRRALCGRLRSSSPNADLNFQIGASVISCFDTDIFASGDLLRLLWRVRVHDATAECEALVGQLLDIS